MYVGLEDIRRLFSSTDENSLPCSASFKACRQMLSHEIVLDPSDKVLDRRRDWSQLSGDILHDIADQLSFPPHLVKFSVCCRRWHEIAADILSSGRLQIPFLLLPYNNTTSVWSFFNPTNNKIYDMKIPELHGYWIFGSSKGWLGAMNEDNFDIVLFNPLTRIHIPLPGLDQDTIEGYHDRASRESKWELSYLRSRLVNKLAISNDPSDTTSSKKCQIAIIFGRENLKLGIWQLGEETGWAKIFAWKKLPSGGGLFQRFHDVICHNGKIFAMRTLHLMIIEYTENGHVIEKQVRNPTVNDDLSFPLSDQYIVLLSSGDLIYIARRSFNFFFKLQRRNAGTASFDVFRLGKENNEWIQTHDLGDDALFIGCNESIAMSTKKCPWFRPNCIYFTDDDHFRHHTQHHGYQYDNGIFSLKENRIVERFDIHHSVSLWPTPAIWYHNTS